MQKIITLLFYLTVINSFSQINVENRFFYSYNETYNEDSSRTYKSIDCIYFSDSVSYRFIVNNEENILSYYYFENKPLKQNLKSIIKEFNYTLKNDVSQTKYYFKIKNKLTYITFIESSFSNSSQYFIDNNKLYEVFYLIKETNKWDKQKVNQAKENDFFQIVNFTEFNPNFVKKHISK